MQEGQTGTKGKRVKLNKDYDVNWDLIHIHICRVMGGAGRGQRRIVVGVGCFDKICSIMLTPTKSKAKQRRERKEEEKKE